MGLDDGVLNHEIVLNELNFGSQRPITPVRIKTVGDPTYMSFEQQEERLNTPDFLTEMFGYESPMMDVEPPIVERAETSGYDSSPENFYPTQQQESDTSEFKNATKRPHAGYRSTYHPITGLQQFYFRAQSKDEASGKEATKIRIVPYSDLSLNERFNESFVNIKVVCYMKTPQNEMVELPQVQFSPDVNPISRQLRHRKTFPDSIDTSRPPRRPSVRRQLF